MGSLEGVFSFFSYYIKAETALQVCNFNNTTFFFKISLAAHTFSYVFTFYLLQLLVVDF